MKYIEELAPGDCFTFNNNKYLLTSDFKSSGTRLSYSLNNGSPKWFEANTMVSQEPIYILDKNNNIIAIKQYTQENID